MSTKMLRAFTQIVLVSIDGTMKKAFLSFGLCLLSFSFVNLVVVDPAYAQNKTLKLYYTHTKERGSFTFKKNGRYDQAVLKKLNYFLRDWRRNEPTDMDPRLFDLVWEVYRQSGAKNHIHVVSAYRSPATNEMLRKTRGGQATKSQHMYGRAVDFFIPGVKTSKLREVAMKLQGGGVGYYPRSNTPFVHLDVASVRAWPRMSRSELVRLFPDGKTLHLPPDGNPLPGYRTALAEYKRRKGAIDTSPASPAPRSQTLLARAEADQNANAANGERRQGLLAGLFTRNRTNNDNARSEVAALPNRSNGIENTASLPTANIPIPSGLDSPDGGSLNALQGQNITPEIIREFASSEAGIADVVNAPDQLVAQRSSETIDQSIEETSVAALPNDLPDRDPAIAVVPALNEEAVGTARAPQSENDSENLKNEVPLLAYAADDQVSEPNIDFNAIMVAALETDRMRVENGALAVPAISDGRLETEPQRYDIASLQAPTLKSHNRRARIELDNLASEGADYNNPRLRRPNMRDAISTRHRSNQLRPDFEMLEITNRVFSKDRLEHMEGPQQAPEFINRYMRIVPDVIYAQGFSTNHKFRSSISNFEGNALNFLPIVKTGG